MKAYWGKEKRERNTELCFVLELEKSADARIDVIAKDVYNLYVNGKFVHYGPTRAAKGYARVDRLGIGKYLTEETNVVSAYVISTRTRTLCYPNEEPLFGAEVRVDGKLKYTAADFACYEMTDRLRKVEKMSSQRGYLEIYNVKQNREPFAVGAFPVVETEEVLSPKLLERTVEFASYDEEFGSFFDEGGVTTDNSEIWKNDYTDQMDGLFGTWETYLSYYRSECDFLMSKTLEKFAFHKGKTDAPFSYKTYAFDRLYCGKFRLKIKAKSKAQIYVLYDDILVDGYVKFNREQILHAMKWTVEPNDYLLETFEVYQAKYITVVTDGESEIESVSILRVEGSETGNFAFACEDKLLEKIVEGAKHTFNLNAYDLYTDCPSRERAGWLCDSYFLAQAEEFLTGGNKVEKSFLGNYAVFENEGKMPKGTLPMCYPSASYGYIPNWVLWFVVEAGEYVKRAGLSEAEPKLKEKVKEAMEFFASKENEFGFIENLGGWEFLEWSEATDYIKDVNFPSNMLYAGALESAAELLGDQAYANRAAALKKTICNWAYDGNYFIDNAVRTDGKLTVTANKSETCQYFAAYFDILPEEERAAFVKRALWEFRPSTKKETHPDFAVSNMFIGYTVRLALLVREEEYALLAEECKQTFAGMVESTGSIWELFSTNASCNHGFGSVVAKYICEAVVGLVSRDERTKTIVFSEGHLPINTSLQIPLQGGVCKIRIENGIREVEVPSGYEIKIRRKN